MEKTNFLQHYESLINTYNNTDDIVCIFRNQMRTLIHERSQNGKYKYQIYLSINPTLISSPLLETLHPTSKDMTRFRLGSHYLPIKLVVGVALTDNKGSVTPVMLWVTNIMPSILVHRLYGMIFF